MESPEQQLDFIVKNDTKRPLGLRKKRQRSSLRTLTSKVLDVERYVAFLTCVTRGDSLNAYIRWTELIARVRPT